MLPVLMFLFLLVLTFGIAYYWLKPTKTESAVQQHLVNIKGSRAGEQALTILKEEGYSSNPAISDIVRQIPGAVGTLDLIRQSGQAYAVSFIMGISVAVAVGTGWIASLFVPSPFLALIVALAAGSIPYLCLFIMREVRFRKCDKLLPEAIDLMARGMRAGHALTAVLEMVGNEVAEPIASEFKRLHEEHSLGLPLREATMNLVSRLPRDDMRFLATAILLQKETGGNLALILDKTAAVARERSRLRGQLMIYTAQGRVTGWILCCMPFIMFGLLSSVNWPYERMLFIEDTGRAAIYIGLGLMVAGVFFIRKIVNIKI
jgi:tight adherence protein B